ncbi:MAG TPA: amidohydrolase family protein, partial [Bryobacteraceae bacterium]|nr:amidohydrolase family protein [Bryobacteraceae bacterium]
YRQLAVTGLSFKDVLAMLTTAPVELFGLKNEGRVAPGFRGDLTILSADPSARGMTAFTEVRYVIREGRVIFDSSKFTR